MFKPNFPKMPPVVFVSKMYIFSLEKWFFIQLTNELTQPDGVEQLCDETEDLGGRASASRH